MAKISYNDGDLTEIKSKSLYIFDMDGTIYLGNQVFEGAVRFIKHLRANGKKVLFFTNNASHTGDFYIGKLQRMGFEATRDEIMTSGDVTVEFLKRLRAGKSVYLMGTSELVENFRNSGINLVDGKGETDIVVTSFDLELTYEKIKTACQAIMRGAEFLSTHPDYNCPTENGFIPDSGAIAALVTASTGKTPTYFGKPYSQTVEMICAKMGLDKSEMVMFGDRLYTDIATGRKNGVKAVLVMTGETTEEMLDKSEGFEQPDCAFESLDALDRMIY